MLHFELPHRDKLREGIRKNEWNKSKLDGVDNTVKDLPHPKEIRICPASLWLASSNLMASLSHKFKLDEILQRSTQFVHPWPDGCLSG